MKGDAIFAAGLVCAALIATVAGAQDVETLRRLVGEQEKKLADQDQAIATMGAKLEQALDEIRRLKEGGGYDSRAVEEAVQAVLTGSDFFFRRPKSIDVEDRAPLFAAEGVQGGLFFTGLFRSRLDLRQNNVDLNSGDNGIDDSGVRLNGRFRLGIGASFLQPEGAPADSREGGSRAPAITALTEFQAYGTFANNSYVTTPNPQQLPKSFSFSLLAEPYEQIGLYQGFLRASNVGLDGFRTTLGRQEIVLGNQLLFGNNSFYDGTVHDAVRLDYGVRTGPWRDDFAISAFYAKEAASDNGIPGPIFDFDEDEFYAVYATYAPKSEPWSIDGYWSFFNGRSALNGGGDFIATGSTAFYFDGAYTPLILGHFHTFGLRGQWNSIALGGGFLTTSAEIAYQTGADSSLNIDEDGDGINDFPHRSIHGWNIELASNFRFYDPQRSESSDLRPLLGFQYYYASGGGLNVGVDDGNPSNDFHESIGFQPMYVNRHFEHQRADRDDMTALYYPGGGRYGNMDAIPLDNVHAFKLAFSVMATPELELGVGIVHAITDSNQGYGSSVFGTELDVFGTYFYRTNIQFGANVSVFFPGSTAKNQSELLFFDGTDPTDGNADDDAAFAFYLQALVHF
jgi:hypothetical protein